MSILRDVLRYLVVEETSNDTSPASQRAADDKDDFGPIRASSLQRSTESLKHRDDELYLCHILHVCVGFLTVGPFLQSIAGEPTRDKELMSSVLGTADKKPEIFLVVFPVLLAKIRQGFLYLGEKTLNVLMDELSKLLQLYAFSRSGRLQQLAIQVLHSTMNLWSTPSISASEVGEKIRSICDWLSGALRKKKINSWSTRDSFAVFLDKYLKHDPEQIAWSISEENEDDEERDERLAGLPAALLMLVNSDEDIRVRFRSASVVGGLFSAARRVSYDPMLVYSDLRRHFTNNLDKCVYLLWHDPLFLIGF
jgi:serine-protein kinase ATM